MIDQLLLFPYSLTLAIRNFMYDKNICKSNKAPVPTICVGNISVGGTGKTPFVEYLIRLLSPHYRVAVLSRGYRRKTHGFVLADSSSSALTIGDEPMQIHTKFPNVPVAVCRNRVEGIHRLQQLCPDVQVVLLDDAFQHRQIRCGYNILLTAYDNLYIDDHFLPMGSLRDAKLESHRAAAVVVTKCPDTLRPIDRRIVDTKLHLPSFQQLCFATILYEDIPQQKKTLLLTGIAHPEYLYQQVKKYNPTTRLMAFPDHYRFSTRDIERIDAEATNYQQVLTTEKDYARLCANSLPETLAAKLNVVPITLSLTNADNLERDIRQYINEQLQPKK